jgi:hypothetical protein
VAAARRARVGRVEHALNDELGDRTDVTVGERAMLRAQARAVDVGEALADPDLVSKATHGYLEVRTAVGLTGRAPAVDDTFGLLLRELSEPRVGDPAQP